MWAAEFIRAFRDGEAVEPDALRAWVSRYHAGEVEDAQMAAWAMAVCFRGMSEDHTVALTEAMRDSGMVFRWEADTPTVDKHSTGGVGDKVSIALAPWVAAIGVRVPMISGRGLGHTGGTLDKLAAIPGFVSRLDARRFAEVVETHGLVLAGQSAEVAPVDQRMYALRDVTGTVESIPLITASILSKKLAEGLDRLVLDVKVGDGAFMSTIEDARLLARSIIDVAGRAGCATTALLTQMDAPLGRSVGNVNELEEAVRFLEGKARDDLFEVTRALAYEMAPGREDELERALGSGAARERLAACVAAQGGDTRALDRPGSWRAGVEACPVRARGTGVIGRISARSVGLAAQQLGAGRQRPGDTIDLSAGIDLDVEVGDHVASGERIGVVFASKREGLERAARAVADAIALEEPPTRGRVLERMA